MVVSLGGVLDARACEVTFFSSAAFGLASRYRPHHDSGSTRTPTAGGCEPIHVIQPTFSLDNA
jgi:hypothetical protein